MSRDPATADAILIVAPEGRDASVLLGLLREVGISARIDETGDALLKAIETGDYAGAIITDEAITRVGLAELRAAVERQPPWSDFPLIVLTPAGAESPRMLQVLAAVGPMTLVKRPVAV